MGEAFAISLSDETLRDFAGQPAFPTRAELEAAVSRHHHDAQEYAPDIRPEPSWRPDHIVLRCPRVVVRDDWPPHEGPLWRETEPASDDGSAFAFGQLHHKRRDAIIEELRDNGYRWFEGLEFDGPARAGVPVHCWIPGS